MGITKIKEDIFKPDASIVPDYRVKSFSNTLGFVSKVRHYCCSVDGSTGEKFRFRSLCSLTDRKHLLFPKSRNACFWSKKSPKPFDLCGNLSLPPHIHHQTGETPGKDPCVADAQSAVVWRSMSERTWSEILRDLVVIMDIHFSFAFKVQSSTDGCDDHSSVVYLGAHFVAQMDLVRVVILQNKTSLGPSFVVTFSESGTAQQGVGRWSLLVPREGAASCDFLCPQPNKSN